MGHHQLLIFDGGGTVWYSMDVLWEHYGMGFSFLGLCRISDFPFSLDQCNELNSLQQFNSRRAIARGLLALFLTKTDPEVVLSVDDPDAVLVEIVAECVRSATGFEELCTALGNFLVEAFYHYPGSRFPLCRGVGEALPSLRLLGYRLALCSNRYRPSVMEILAAHGLCAQFDCIFGAGSKEDERLIKPLPELLRLLGVDKSDCLFVGDSALDIRSATHVGMEAIALLCGMGTRRSLLRCSPKIILDDARQLIPYLTGGCHAA